MEASRKERTQVVDKLLSMVIYSSRGRRPGELLKHLTSREHEVCKQLSAEDFNHRVSYPMIG